MDDIVVKFAHTHKNSKFYISCFKFYISCCVFGPVHAHDPVPLVSHDYRYIHVIMIMAGIARPVVHGSRKQTRQFGKARSATRAHPDD